MSDFVLYILVGVAVAFGTLGGIYRVVDPDSWPWWLDGLASASWYVLAVIAGALGAAALMDREGASDDPEGDDHDPKPDPETAADELEQGTDEQIDQEQEPSDAELAEDLNELTDDA